MNTHLITTTDALAAFCEEARSETFVTIDTEFMRERTYYSILCLVQVATTTNAVAIDPLASGIDLAPLYALLDDPKVLKVFHAARQDIEIFVQATGRVPTPLFDTQVAAMVCGYGEQISYENLVLSLAKKQIDKSSRFTDWSHRPLSDKQIIYALGDVTHLRVVYEKLTAELERTGRSEWVREEMGVLCNPTTYSTEPSESWHRIKVRGAKPRALAVLREIAAWRELEAQRVNLPRARVVKDEQLADIALHAPKTAEDFAKLRGLPQGFAGGRYGAAILEAVARALEQPLETYPVPEERRVMKNGSGAILELLKVLLRQVSDEKGVAAKLIASSDDLERLACEDAPDIKTLQGWRRQLFGETALALKNGELAMAIKRHKVELIKV